MESAGWAISLFDQSTHAYDWTDDIPLDTNGSLLHNNSTYNKARAQKEQSLGPEQPLFQQCESTKGNYLKW